MRMSFVFALLLVGVISPIAAHVVHTLPTPLPADVVPYHDRYVMDWHGCPHGSCSPSFSPIPDGSYQFLGCAAGWCVLRTYVYWTDESCNVLVTCPYYPEHRNH